MTRTPISRRRLLQHLVAVGAGCAGRPLRAATAPSAHTPFFTTARRDGRWWFMAPQGEPFFSVALNHIDPAALRLAENGAIWRDKYGNSMQRWLRESVRPNLLAWGFNAVGWVQEVVVIDQRIHRHSRNFTFEEYQWLGLPYFHLLPLAEIHQWDVETRYPDFRGPGFADWCDWVAREHCARMADDPKLVGYFYSDCPTWAHTRPDMAWKGPLFDPERLKSAAGRKELFDLATRYYQVAHEAVRRYDKHHLICGDRYEANMFLPEEVVRAALPWVDVLSFQCFGGGEHVRDRLSHWAELSGKPVLLADGAARKAAKPDSSPSKADRHHDPAGYRDLMEAVRGVPGCVGFHLCGAYLRNNARRCGLLDERERPDEEAVQGISAVNHEMTQWVIRTSGGERPSG
jgi:hypothetical protein